MYGIAKGVFLLEIASLPVDLSSFRSSAPLEKKDSTPLYVRNERWLAIYGENRETFHAIETKSVREFRLGGP